MEKIYVISLFADDILTMILGCYKSKENATGFIEEHYKDFIAIDDPNSENLTFINIDKNVYIKINESNLMP